MDIHNVIDTVSVLGGLLGITSGGLLYVKANRLKAESEGRQSKAQAELEEANVYKARIKSLGEEVEALEAKVKNLNQQIDEMTEQRDKYKALAGIQELTIEELNQRISQREKQNAELTRSNRSLKGQVTKLTKANNELEAKLGIR